ncbi:carboxypeptidase family protein [Arcicella aurantiaca]|uniref:Carboxypeptidase family protein n=1 Tax=Arcicella aurantiaca TaxID=591202 RepID=A0A316EVD1_9BACT|nr:outer membrane beta-barrel protein [Arcicella aurantiaca]PWK27146.1 carboxypeptidase family protein [Arcicella aurantiaca]
MKKQFLLLLLFTFSTSILIAQTSVSGEVRELATQKTLRSAYVSLVNLADSSRKRTIPTDAMGKFQISPVRRGNYSLRVSFLGYQEFRKNIQVSGDEPVKVDSIYLIEDSQVLNEVKIVGQVAAVIQKKDTLQFNAKAYKVNPDANADELIEKIPGAVIDNGKMQIQGEEVKQVMIDGKLFFGKDATAAMKNIPAEVIDKIQVFDQLSEQSQLTGLDDGNTTKTVNITTRPDMRNGLFGRNSIGIGTNDTYKGNASINRFKGNSRLTVLFQANNINQQNFSSEDLIGVSSGSAQSRRGGGGGGGNRGGGQGGGSTDNSGNFLVNNQPGYNTTNALGLNYSNEWGTKLKFQGSYFLNQANNSIIESTFQQYIQSNNTGQTYTESSNSSTKSLNHRAYFRLEYKIDDRNSLIFTPNLSFQNTEANSGYDGVTKLPTSKLNDVINRNISSNNAVNFSNNILFRHRFAKMGRALTLNITTTYNDRNANNELRSTNNFYGANPSSKILNQNSNTDAKGLGFSSNLYYSEPLSKQSSVFVSTSFGYNENQSEKYAYNFSDSEQKYNRLDTLLSNVFNSDYYNYRVGTGFRQFSKAMNISAEIRYQNAHLMNEQIFPKVYNLDKSFNNILPSFSMRYNIDGSAKSLRFNYQTQTQQPSISQLQEVVNNNNPLRLSTGNSSLSQEYQHQLSLRYTATSPTTFSNFVTLMSANFVKGNITNSSFIATRDTVISKEITLKAGSQLSRPVNLDGQYSIRGFMSYGFPVKALKMNINTNITANFSRTPGLINTVLNYSDAQKYTFGLVLSSNISPNVDFTISSNSNLSYVQNTISSSLNNNYFNQNLKVRLNIIFWKGIVFNTDATYYSYSGLSSSFNQAYTLWNMAIGKKVFAKQQGEIRLSIFDLLKLNTSIQRNITTTYIEDSQSNVLQQFFMLTFSYNLKKYWKS